jgi:hypothetical protein
MAYAIKVSPNALSAAADPKVKIMSLLLRQRALDDGDLAIAGCNVDSIFLCLMFYIE